MLQGSSSPGVALPVIALPGIALPGIALSRRRTVGRSRALRRGLPVAIDHQRRLLLALTAGGMMSPFLALGDAVARTPPSHAETDHASNAAHAGFGSIQDFTLSANENIAMLVYPGFTALDLVGPHYMFASMMGARVHLVTTTSTLDPVESDLGLSIRPTMTMAACPADLDVLFIPGGTRGTVDIMNTPDTIRFVRDRGSRAKHVTSVCTGSLILGAAGLLEGRRATSHWSVRHLLADLGAQPVAERVVRDGNVTTGAGVSAGLDLGLALLAELRGANYARTIQLQAEYAPQPPYDAGTPETAPKDVTAAMTALLANFVDSAKTAARREIPGV